MPAIITDSSYLTKLEAVRQYAIQNDNWNDVGKIMSGERPPPGDQDAYTAIVRLVYIEKAEMAELDIKVVYTIDSSTTYAPVHHLSVSAKDTYDSSSPPMLTILFHIARTLHLPDPIYVGTSPYDTALHYLADFQLPNPNKASNDQAQ